MSGGSSDDAVLAIGHADPEGRAVMDCLLGQCPKPPFDPRAAVARFARTLAEYRVLRIVGDRYAGETFRADFRSHGITYEVATLTKHQMYEALEPRLNAREVRFLDAPLLEQQLLGLTWRSGKIDHPGGEHDDFSNAAAGVVWALRAMATTPLQIYAVNTTPALVRPDGTAYGPKVAAFLRDE
jgi:hypothetical protein